MAGRKKEYESRAIISKITATSRNSVKVRDNYFTVEYTEERIIPSLELDRINIDEERKLLWDTVNLEVDKQIQDIFATFDKKNKN